MEDPSESPPAGRLEEKVVRGVRWTVLVVASQKVLTFGTTLVLARLLTPSDFGLVALATVAIGAASLFGNLGLSGALVVRRDLDARTKGTVFTLMLAAGGLTTAVIAGLSPLAAKLLDEPRLSPVLAVLGSTVLLSAPTLFYRSVLQRELEFRALFKGQLAQSISYAAVAISSAAGGAGVWSIVAGQICGTIAFAATLHYLNPHRVRPTFGREAAWATLKQGRGFVAQGGLGFVEDQVDYLAVGGFGGAAPLGHYSMAFRLSEMPYWTVTEPVAAVTFPGFARIAQRDENVRASFLSVLQLVTLVACPMGVLLSAAASPFTTAIFGEEWLPLIGILAILGIRGTVNHVEASAGWLLNSLGRAGLNAGISAVAVVPLALGVFVAARFGSATAVAWVMLVHAVVSMLMRMAAVHRSLLIAFTRQWRAVGPVLMASIPAWVLARLVAEATVSVAAGISLGASVSAGLGAYAAMLSLVDPGVLPRSASQLRRVLRKARTR